VAEPTGGIASYVATQFRLTQNRGIIVELVGALSVMVAQYFHQEATGSAMIARKRKSLVRSMCFWCGMHRASGTRMLT